MKSYTLHQLGLEKLLLDI